MCTASIGVLRSGNIQFDPPLPKWKVDAINQVEMGNYVKIYCTFQTRWWDNHEYIFIASNNKGEYPQWMPIHGGQPMLMAVVSGEKANELEKRDPEQVKDEIHLFLSRAYPIKAIQPNALKPTDIHICKWMTDPRFCGSYSFLPTGCFNENPVFYHWLTEPVATKFDGVLNPPSLFFAGEAYDFNYGGQL